MTHGKHLPDYYERIGKHRAREGMRKRRKALATWNIPHIEGIDGETQNGRYVLLASSDRPPLYNPKGITALQFIDYLLEAPKGTIQVGYVTHYDITKGLLSGLNDTQRHILLDTEWLAFNRFDKPVTIRIHYIYHRTLEIWEYEQMDLKDFWDKNKKWNRKFLRKAMLYSVERFSSSGPFLETMENFNMLLDKPFMESMKKLRGWSLWDEVPRDLLIEYNRNECVMTKIWTYGVIFFYHGIGIDLRRYNGYGSAASLMLRKLNVKEYFQESGIFTIDELSRLYIAGRSELFRNGEISDVYYYDLKNAYVTALSLIPSLSPKKVRWQEIRYPSMEDLEYFGVSRVSWKSTDKTDIIWGPLPVRDMNGAIYFPLEGSGLYHNLEVLEAIKRDNWEISVEWTRIAIPNIPENFENMTLEEAQKLRKGLYEYPLEKVRSMVDARAKMKKAIEKGSMSFENFGLDELNQLFMEQLMKELLPRTPLAVLDLYKGMGNSCYGKLAEKPHGKKLPSYNNLLFASFITSWCRAQLLRHLQTDSIIMTATDSLICTKPIFGENLIDGFAKWDLKKHYSHGFFLVAGVYSLGDLPSKPYDEWTREDRDLFKTRGVPAEELLKVWEQFKAGTMREISVDVPMLNGWKVYYTRSKEWLQAYKAKYGQDFKADEWCPVTKSLSADSNKKRDFRGGNKYIPSIPAVPNTTESQAERRYRMFEGLGVSEAQFDNMVWSRVG